MPRTSGSFALGKTGKNLHQGLVKGQLPILVQEHSHGSGRDHLGDAGQIIDRGCGNSYLRLTVGEAANTIECEYLASGENTEGRARKSLLRNRPFENGVRFGKPKPLPRSRRWNHELRRRHAYYSDVTRF